MCAGAGTSELANQRAEASNRFDTVGSMLSVTCGDDLESYVSAVEFYSKRHLSNISDRQNAFQGILKRYGGFIDGAQSAFSFGLPISAFDQTICWRSRKHSTNPRNPTFPSWSWLGWQGGVEFDRKMIHVARTKQMIYMANSRAYPGYFASLSARKPATCESGFGFPGSASGMFQNQATMSLWASVARLRIEADAQGDDHHGHYAVWATTCRHFPPSDAERTGRMTIWESLYGLPPTNKGAAEEDFAAPCLPLKLTHVPNDLTAPCSEYGVCIAKEPLGYISLDRKWRAAQGEECAMHFIALAGEKDEVCEEEWVISMLMCLQRKAKVRYSDYERVQVVDCMLKELWWLEAGAENALIRLA